MRTMLTVTPIDNGKVIRDCHITTLVYDDHFSDTQLGLAVRQAIDNARKLGFHAAAPNFYLRVEFKVLP